MGRGEVAAIPVQLLDGVAEQIGSQKVRVSEHPGGIKGHFPWTIGSDDIRKEPACLGCEICIRVANRRCTAKNGFAYGRVQTPLQPWNDLVPDKVPCRIGPEIGRVDPVGDSIPTEIVEHLFPRHGKEGAYHADSAHAPAARHPRKSSQSSATEEPKEHRLGLVIRRMSGRNPPGSRVLRESAKRVVARDSRVLFRSPGRDRQGCLREPKGPAVRQVSNEGRIRIRLRSAKSVMDMANHELGRASESRTMGDENVEQRHRVGSAGYRDEQGISDRKHPAALDRVPDGPL